MADKYTLIELPDGELCLVSSMKGHRGCKVIARRVTHPGHGHAKLVNGKWVEDLEAKAAADEEARLRRMTRTELLEEAIRRART